MFFLLGFLIAAAGFAMLVRGPFPLGKNQVKSRPARVAGAIWVGYLPVAFAARFVHARLDPAEIINPAVIYGILLGLCLPAGAIIILRSAYEDSGQRRQALAAAGSRNPFADPKISEGEVSLEVLAEPDNFFLPPPPPKASSSKNPRRQPPEKNPFDFS